MTKNSKYFLFIILLSYSLPSHRHWSYITVCFESLKCVSMQYLKNSGNFLRVTVEHEILMYAGKVLRLTKEHETSVVGSCMIDVR